MAMRKDLLAGLSGLGTGVSKMGQMMMERERFDTNKALELEEADRKAALHPHQLAEAEAGAGKAKVMASEALAAADLRKGADAASQAIMAENEAAGWTVDPDDQGNVGTWKAELNALNRYRMKEGKPALSVPEYVTSKKGEKLERTKAQNTETRDAEKHTSDMETDKSQRRLLGAQADKGEAEAKATPHKPPTESQSNSALFGRRLELAIRDMEEIKTGGHDPASIGAGAARGLSKLPGGNLAVSKIPGGDATQRQKNAETNFLTAVLRKESGASISPTEFSTGEQLYFERAGDSEAVKQQKARNRDQALLGLKAAAGSAWEAVDLTPAGEKPAAAGKPKAPLANLSDEDLDAQLRAKGIDPATGKRISKGGASGTF